MPVVSSYYRQKGQVFGVIKRQLTDLSKIVKTISLAVIEFFVDI